MNTTRVLIAMDGSEESMRAAREAVALFGEGAEFFVLNVAAVPMTWSGGAFGAVDVMPVVDIERLVEEAGEAAETNTIARAEEAGIPSPEILVEHGHVVDTICDAADEHDVNVVVIGSHDRGLISRLFSPSISDGVVRGSFRPVLVVSGTPPSP